MMIHSDGSSFIACFAIIEVLLIMPSSISSEIAILERSFSGAVVGY